MLIHIISQRDSRVSSNFEAMPTSSITATFVPTAVTKVAEKMTKVSHEAPL